VSILIPAYNAERWLAQTIRSALAQTWPKKEIIVVDDGSRDGTLGVARGFESPSVLVLTQENRGASTARNRALSHANGEYIQWLDADDLLAPDKIERQFRRTDYDWSGLTLLSSAFGEFYYRPGSARFTPTSLWQDWSPLEFMVTKLRENLWMCPAVWLVSRELTDLAGPWDEKLSLNDDGEYFARVVLASEKILFVPDSRVYKRSVECSLSLRTSVEACRSLFASHRACFQHILSVEDSPRTREVCLATLQRWYIYYYPEKTELVQKANELAASLGGELEPPRFKWKYALIQKTFGWNLAKAAQRLLPIVRTWFERNLDRLLKGFRRDEIVPKSG